MDPLTTSISIILGKYALEKSGDLVEKIGPKALAAAEEMLGAVLGRLRTDTSGTVIADEFEKSPGIYQNPLEQKLDEIIKSDPEFAAKLKRLLDRYNQEEQKHVISAKYESDLSGTGSIAQGEGSTSVTATKHGIAIGSVQGDLKLNRND